jgi:hypothetical protein
MVGALVGVVGYKIRYFTLHLTNPIGEPLHFNELLFHRYHRAQISPLFI